MGGKIWIAAPLVLLALLLAFCGRTLEPARTTVASGGSEPASHTETAEEPACSPIGTNLAMPSYWSASSPFVDAMKPTFHFISGSSTAWEDDRELALDRHGWVKRLLPDQIARVFIFQSEQPHPTGRFTVLYEGEGHIDYHGTVRNLKRRPGHHTFDLDEGGLFLNITEVNPDDPIRDIRMLLPGGRCADDAFAYCEDDAACGDARCVPFVENYDEQPFHPQFLAELRPFRAFRFMDWMHTNREVAQEDGVDEPEPIRELSEYPVREDKSWRPVPIDVMVDLANQIGADAWFNMPHQASDDFVRRFARRVADRLRPDLRVYVEYSNETWNTIFDQHHWVNSRGCRTLSDAPREECDGDGDGALCEPDLTGAARKRCTLYGQRWLARRTAEVGRMWRAAFGPDADRRVVRVMGVQVGGSWWYEDVLRYEWNGEEPTYEAIDAIATAPYFSIPKAGTVDRLFARAPADGAKESRTYAMLTGTQESAHENVLQLVRRDMNTLLEPELRHLDLLAYEAGQGLQTYDPEQAKVYVEGNRDPRMRDVYREYLKHWTRLTGGSLLMHFSSASAYSDHGAWGAKEYQGQPREQAPKYDALVSYIERHPACGAKPPPAGRSGTPRSSAGPGAEH